MKSTKQSSLTGRIGAPTNLRAGGVMRSATRKRDARFNRRAARLAMRRGEEA